MSSSGIRPSTCTVCGRRHSRNELCRLPLETALLCPVCTKCGFRHGDGRPCLIPRTIPTGDAAIPSDHATFVYGNGVRESIKRGARKRAIQYLERKISRGGGGR